MLNKKAIGKLFSEEFQKEDIGPAIANVLVDTLKYSFDLDRDLSPDSTRPLETSAGNVKMNGPEASPGSLRMTARSDHIHPSDDSKADLDHIHPSDDSKADLESPAFTGTPTLPTGTIATTQSVGNNTTAVATTAFVNAEIAEVTGGGSGVSVSPGINYDNGQFETTQILGYSTYADTAQATPVDGTGGTATITFAHSTSSPLIGTGMGLLTKPASNCQGNGVSYDFTIDRGLLNQPIEIKFDYEASANYVDGAIGLFLYDKTNAILIPISVQAVPASYGQAAYFKAVFLPSTSTSYRLIWHVTVATTTDWTFKIDNVQVGIQNVAVGACISEWQSYPISIDGVALGTGGSYNGKWRRVGSSMEYQGHFVLGTSGFNMPSSPMTLNLPPGLTADTSKVSRETGYSRLNGNAQSYDSSAAVGYLAIPVIYPNGKISFITHGSGTVGLGNPFTWAANDEFYFNISVPIAQWTSNVNLASDFTEYAYNYSTTAVSDSTSFGYGSEGAMFQAFAPTGLGSIYKTVRFTRPIQPSDIIIVEVKLDGTAGWLSTSERSFGMQENDAGTIRYGMHGYGSGSTDYKVQFFSLSNKVPANTWASIANQTAKRWRVRKISNGNMAEVPPVVSAIYNVASSLAVSATTQINFATKIEDTHNAVTTGASWKFTAPISGLYLINCTVNTTVGASDFLIYKNGVLLSLGQRYLGYGTTTSRSGSSRTIRLSAGDYFDIRPVSSVTIDGSVGVNVTRIGS